MAAHSDIVWSFLLPITLQLIVPCDTKLCCDDLILMISFDGFRYDYLDLVKKQGKKTPYFDSLIQNGVQAEYMKNVFITKTFPNHYTLVTGMYEESHGVVSNNMLDVRIQGQEVFSPSVSNMPGLITDLWFSNYTMDSNLGPEPIWVTNQKGKDQDGRVKRSGVIMWPGMIARIHGQVAEKRMPFNRSVSNETKIDTIVDWFASKDDPINLGLVYFNEPDHTGHAFGPDSPEIIDMVVALDGLVGYLVKRLKDNDLFEKVNIIITSDHGMQQIKNITYLDDFVSEDDYEVYGSSPVLSVRAKPDGSKSEEDLYSAFKNCNCHITVYNRSEIPSKYRYTHNERILPILLLADDHWQICTTKTNCYLTAGNHGFSNDKNEMHPIFIAHGPAFKKGHKSRAFNNVDIYPLLCKLLGVTPGPNNGSLSVVNEFLEEKDNYLTVTGITFILAAGFAATVTGICSIAAIRHKRRERKLNIRNFNPHIVHTDVPASSTSSPSSDINETSNLLTASDNEEIP